MARSKPPTYADLLRLLRQADELLQIAGTSWLEIPGRYRLQFIRLHRELERIIRQASRIPD